MSEAMDRDWKPAYRAKIFRRFAQYTGDRPTRKATRSLDLHAEMWSIHMNVQIEYCPCEPSKVVPGHSWSPYGQVTQYRFRCIALDDVVFEVSSSKSFDQGSVQLFFARSGEEVAMSQDELDWARWWGANGRAEDTHPHLLWRDEQHKEGAAK